MNVWLVDTGPIVAYLNAADPWHQAAADALEELRGPFWTTCAVVTEAMYFLNPVQGGARLLSDFLREANLELYPCNGFGEIARAVSLMEKYRDAPMDFADATLILLAHARETSRICTLDRRGFSTFRTLNGKRFTMTSE